MAEALFASRKVDRDTCIDIAAGLGLDRQQFAACADSPEIGERVEGYRSVADEVGVRGTPTFWIDRERFEGSHTTSALRSSVQRALRRM